MEGLIITLLLVIVVLLLRNGNRLEAELRLVHLRLQQLADRVRELSAPTATQGETRSERPPQPRPLPREEPRPAPRPQWEPTPPPRPAPAPEAPQAAADALRNEAPPFPLRAGEAPLQRFLREHPDLEKFIGENLVNKIGIAVLVLGIAFFVKYAIDQNWINRAGRVAIGIGCGALLVGLAHFLRRSYKAFSAVLSGGGSAVFYSTIAFAYHQYHLFGQGLSFALLVVVTAFAVLLAVLYDSLALAVIATVGGFATPFLVSDGSGNYVALLSYLGILNAGLLALAFFRRWPLLQALAFGFTVLITGTWIATYSDAPGAVRHGLALALVTVNYGLFLGAALAFPVRFGRPFRAFELSLLLLLTGAYYAGGMLLLAPVAGGRYQGLFTIGAGLVNLVLALYCQRRRGTDRNLLYLLLGLTLSFATLAVPVQLQGHAITLFWSAEFVLLYWLYLRSRMPLFRIGSWLLMALATGSLLLDWFLCPPTDGGLLVLFNNTRGAVTNAVAVLAFAAYWKLLQRPDDRPGRTLLAWISGTAALLLLYASLLSAVNLYFYNQATVDVPNVYHRMITAVLALATGYFLLRRQSGAAAVLNMSLAAGALLYYLFSQEAIDGLRAGIAAGRFAAGHLYFHGLATLLYLALLLRAALLAARPPAFAAARRPLAWIISAATVLFLSLDARHYYALGGDPASQAVREAQYLRAALTILWGLCSFALMALGMRYRAQVLRVISLSLFLLALLKLFFFDLRHISEGGKIAAFILLGALLLTVSFLYQKLKKVLIDDRPV